MNGDTTVVRDERAARFRWSVLRTELSPLAWNLIDPLSVRPALVVDAGALESEGVTTRAPVLASDPWLGVGFGAHLILRPVDPLFIDLSGAILGNFTRGQYSFVEESAPFFRIPASTSSLTLTPGVRF
jgi:hypothetical protein